MSWWSNEKSVRPLDEHPGPAGGKQRAGSLVTSQNTRVTKHVGKCTFQLVPGPASLRLEPPSASAVAQGVVVRADHYSSHIPVSYTLHIGLYTPESHLHHVRYFLASSSSLRAAVCQRIRQTLESHPSAQQSYGRRGVPWNVSSSDLACHICMFLALQCLWSGC